uniref:Uncharacterized protein n=1 Tax=viral metagenome TaxID=1070528 RepID=A0A6M3L8U6_9ZZZZ
MIKFISDNRIILNINAVRCITKCDHISSIHGDSWYDLKVAYKGHVEIVRYNNIIERDKIFTRIAKELKKGSKSRKETSNGAIL